MRTTMNGPTPNGYFKHIVSGLHHCGQVSLVLNQQQETICISPYAYDLIIRDLAPAMLPSIKGLLTDCNEPKLIECIEQFKYGSKPQQHAFSVALHTLDDHKQDDMIGQVLEVSLSIISSESDLVIIILRLADYDPSLEPINEQQTLEAIVHYAPIAIWFVGASGNMHFFNKAFCKTLEQPKEDFVDALHYAEKMPFRIAVSCMSSDMYAIETNQPYVLRSKVKLKNGSIKFMEITKLPLRNQDGSIRGVIGIASDLTDIRQAKDDLSREKDRAMVTLSAIGDGVITTDNNGIIDFINPAAERLIGWSAHESTGTPINKLFIRKHGSSLKPKFFVFDRPEHELPFLDRSRSTLTTRSGKELSIQESIASIHNQNGRQTGLVITFKDCTETKKLTEKLEHFSKHDPLTGLLNRQEMFRIVEDEIKKKAPKALFILIDLDQFKIIMNTAGNSASNFLIKYVANSLNTIIDKTDFLGRLSSDTFGVFAFNKSQEHGKSLARKISQHFKNNPFRWQDSQYNLSSSIGIVELNKATQSVDKTFTQANIACYTAKDSGRGRFHLYSDNDKPIFKLQDDLLIIQDIEYALRNNLFELYAQPIICLKDPDKKRIEILVRMRDRKNNLIQPNDFIVAAENYGLMPHIDAWILENLARHHMNDLLSRENLSVNINLSGKSLSNDSLMNKIHRFLSKKTMINHRLCFEITETSAIKQMDVALRFMHLIRSLGCQLALDDFGSGLSSFRYLKNLPIDILKIDGSFVINMNKDKVDHVMVSSIINVAKTIGIEVVAEFVETPEIEAELKALNVDYAQGFYYSEPVELKQYLRKL